MMFSMKAQMHIGAEGLVGFPDTVKMGDEISFGCYIVNNTGFDYASFIKLYYSVDGDTVETPLEYYTFLPIINGDSIGLFVDSMIAGSPTWHLGSDVVVVWPATAYGDGPSLEYLVEVQDSTIINAVENSLPTKHFYFDTEKKEIHVLKPEEFEMLNIFGIDGRLIISLPASHTIQVHSLMSGIFILQFQDKQGKRYTSKIIIH